MSCCSICSNIFLFYVEIFIMQIQFINVFPFTANSMRECNKLFSLVTRVSTNEKFEKIGFVACLSWKHCRWFNFCLSLLFFLSLNHRSSSNVIKWMTSSQTCKKFELKTHFYSFSILFIYFIIYLYILYSISFYVVLFNLFHYCFIVAHNTNLTIKRPPFWFTVSSNSLWLCFQLVQVSKNNN